ncbi:endolytic transglycosylase MltG [Sporichthya polymorpha]|uniref:endolytic transglycosylase MltG n=1 Tax=Sporichthya polymorpha TaxID=35751 RepID=UPI00037AAD10|nr:endolytic transglycosylase MltG [Sporichthya polymorpha]
MSDSSPPPYPPADEPVPGPARRPRKAHRRTRRKALIAVVISLVVLGSIGVGATVGINRIYERLTEGTADFSGPPGAEKVVQVTQGSSIRAIGRMLEEAGVVRTEGSFVAAARKDSRAASLQPGFYRLNLNMPAREALTKMLDPASRILARIAIPEGRSAAQAIAKLSKESGIPKEDFEKVLDNPKALGLPGWARNKAEGFLFPATYDVEPNASAESILKQMVTRFNVAATATDLVARSAIVGRTPLEVLTIASLIEKEAKLADDQPKVARVIYNRLEENMRLQLDSTVHYAVGGAEVVTTTAEQRAIDSPYNTYRYEGLPPGPIASPGEAAIEAALSPAEGPWIYFVAVNPDTGETKYGVTAADHARNVEEFRAWLRANPGR